MRQANDRLYSAQGLAASIAALREALGDRDFDVAWAEGTALSIDEAIAYAQRVNTIGANPLSAGPSAPAPPRSPPHHRAYPIQH